MSSLTIVQPQLHPSQVRVVESTARFKVLAAGRRWRKTSLGVQMTLATGLRGGRAWWVAPTYPVANIGWRFVKGLARQIPCADILEAERLIVLPGGGEVQTKSAENPDSLRGSGLDGLVIDEAAYVKEEAWTEGLRPALSDRRGWALFISSPNGFNWFYKLFEQAETLPGWARWQFPTWDNPHIAAEEIEAARREVGVLVFRQEYGAEFIDLGSLKPFHRDWIRYWGTDEEPAPNLSDLVIEGGFDPAISKRDGAARSVLVVAGQMRSGLNRGRIYVLHVEAGHWSPYEQAAVILKAVRQQKLRTIRIEDVAYQGALAAILDREARRAKLIVHIDLVKVGSQDKVMRANKWSAFVEDGTVLFGSGQQELVRAMLEIPQDETMWDLVDAAGLCVTGFPALQGESSPIPGMESSDKTLATSYATRIERKHPTAPPPLPSRPVLNPRLSGMKRAAGYSARIKRTSPPPTKQMMMGGHEDTLEPPAGVAGAGGRIQA